MQTSCRRSNGATETVSPGCHDTFAAFYASFGDLPTFPLGDKGYRVTRKTWLCFSEQLAVDGRWIAPSPALSPAPLRACASVVPA